MASYSYSDASAYVNDEGDVAGVSKGRNEDGDSSASMSHFCVYTSCQYTVNMSGENGVNKQVEFELAPGRMVGQNHPVFVIAEIGQNHQGDINIAKELIKVAKDAGADCAKFQKSNLAVRFNRAARERPYNSRNAWGPTYGEHKAFLEFSEAEFRELQAYAKEIGIFFTSSAFDESALEFLDSIDVPFLKIPSADANNFQYIERAAKMNRPLVISTGMQDMETVKQIYETVKAHHDKFVLLQCTSTYPLDAKDVHLLVIQEYKERFPDVPIGYSGHEGGVAITTAAVALGAKVVERHITLNKSWKGSDHAASLDPAELTALVKAIREVETALGTRTKKMRDSESALLKKMGKSIVARGNIPRGTIILKENTQAKVAEPSGIQPQLLKKRILGRRTRRDLADDETILEEDLE
ncbi:N-acetylneuraminate-9-phosphate synthase-like [Diadema antillarum]|uniref:N-acetylneuraminate-9-phosphate synthase-like n=1 Tax=Diadema antillarum TaxID=105358 RepID=UPI003A89A766